MPAKRLLMLQLRSTGESIASKVEEGWDVSSISHVNTLDDDHQDMIDVVAREFELVAPTVRFSLVLPPLEPGAGSTSPRYMRLLPSSWPEILDTALASRANDGLVSIAVDGRLEERLSLLPADYAGIGIKRQQSPEQYESSERSCTHSPESVPQTPPSAEIAKVVMTASDGAAVCYKAKCKTTINRLLSAFARRSASDPDMLRVLDERRFRRIDCLTVGQWLDQHGVDVERVDDGLPILRASIQEEQCGGKPVIYLYPPSTAEVTVRVAVCPQCERMSLFKRYIPLIIMSQGVSLLSILLHCLASKDLPPSKATMKPCGESAPSPTPSLWIWRAVWKSLISSGKVSQPLDSFRTRLLIFNSTASPHGFIGVRCDLTSVALTSPRSGSRSRRLASSLLILGSHRTTRTSFFFPEVTSWDTLTEP